MSKPKLIKLKNGAVILYQHRKMCNASALSAGFFVGHKDCMDTMPGLTHFLEHMLFLGTNKRDKAQIREEKIKYSMNAGTSATKLDATCYVSNQQINNALDLMSDLLLNSSFPEDLMTNELKVVFEERDLKKSKDIHDFNYQNYTNLHGESMLNVVNRIGTEDCLGKVTRDELFKYRDKYFTIDNFFFAVTTSLSLCKIKKLVRKYFISKIALEKSSIDHDRHYYNELQKPNLKIVNDKNLSSYKVSITSAFASERAEFVNNPGLSFIQWFNVRYKDNFYKKCREQGLVYTANHSNSIDGSKGYSYDCFNFETSQFDNIEKIFKLINENIKYLKTHPITNDDLKAYVEEKIINHDKDFPCSYSVTNDGNLFEYYFYDKMFYWPFKKRIKDMKNIKISYINTLIDRLFNEDNKFFITIMGPTDGKEFKTLKEYKKMLLK